MCLDSPKDMVYGLLIEHSREPSLIQCIILVDYLYVILTLQSFYNLPHGFVLEGQNALGPGYVRGHIDIFHNKIIFIPYQL